MNFDTTSRLLEALSPYTINSDITINTESKGFLNHLSDLVMIDELNNVGFEVIENEIIVYYFTDHTHFEDYSSELEAGQDDYIKRAEAFLVELLSEKVRCIKTITGKTIIRDQYYIIYLDGREDEYIGGTFYSITKYLIPFFKKRTESTLWMFDKTEGIFTELM